MSTCRSISIKLAVNARPLCANIAWTSGFCTYYVATVSHYYIFSIYLLLVRGLSFVYLSRLCMPEVFTISGKKSYIPLVFHKILTDIYQICFPKCTCFSTYSSFSSVLCFTRNWIVVRISRFLFFFYKILCFVFLLPSLTSGSSIFIFFFFFCASIYIFQLFGFSSLQGLLFYCFYYSDLPLTLLNLFCLSSSKDLIFIILIFNSHLSDFCFYDSAFEFSL